MFVGSDQTVGLESQACHKTKAVSLDRLANILLVESGWVSTVWVRRSRVTTGFQMSDAQLGPYQGGTSSQPNLLKRERVPVPKGYL